MKKMMMIIILITLMLTGCASSKVEKVEKPKENASRFEVVESTLSWLVVADKETGVMYAVSHGTYNIGDFTLLVDADGKPLIYENARRGTETEDKR